MMPYEVGKTFIIRVPLLSIETYKELCSEKDGLPVIKTKETLTGYTHKLFTLRRKNGYREACPCHLCPRCGGRMGTGGICPVYGAPTLRAMHPIHKCVAKGAPHLFH